MKRIVLVLAAMLLVSACEKEKNRPEFYIQGKAVEMKTQAPVPGVYLKLYSAVEYEGAYVLWREIGSATTDGTGSFRIEYNLYSGVALFNFAGLNPKYTKVRIDGGAERNIDEYFYYVVSAGGNYRIELIEE